MDVFPKVFFVTCGAASTPEQEPPKIIKNTAKQDLKPPDLSIQNIVEEDIAYETDEDEFGAMAEGDIHLNVPVLMEVVEEQPEPQRVIYETDEEEFWRPDQEHQDGVFAPANSAKDPVPKKPKIRVKKTSRKNIEKGYQLAYFSLWWSRMTRESQKEQEEVRSRKERDQRLTMWTSWTGRHEQTNMRTNVLYERPLDEISDFTTDVNTFNLVGETTQHSGGILVGEGMVPVEVNTVFTNEAQPRTPTTFDDMICEQHQGDLLYNTLELAPAWLLP